MSRRKPTIHLELAVLLDYLDRRLDAASRRKVEEHLALPCSACRASLREAGGLVDLMRADRSAAVPPEVRRRGIEAYVPPRREPRGAPILVRAARLVFDSSTSPLAAATRRAVGEARRLRYEMDGVRLELECEPDAAGSVILRGRVEADEPALHRVQVTVGAERREAWVDSDGGFVLLQVPRGPAEVVLAAPGGSYRLPALEL
jgi:hypothetical protein